MQQRDPSGRAFINTALCYQDHLPHGCCALASNRTVVHDITWGLCSNPAARSYMGGRLRLRCGYFIVLREPMARAVSAYNFFCVACSQSNEHCQPPRTPACPNVTIGEYLRAVTRPGEGRGPLLNLYVSRLGISQQQVLHNDNDGLAPSEEAYTRASRRLRNTEHVLALPLDSLSDAAVRARVTGFLGDEYASPSGEWAWEIGLHGNSFEGVGAGSAGWKLRGSRHAPRRMMRTLASLTATERAEVEAVMLYDLKLYRQATLQLLATLGRDSPWARNHPLCALPAADPRAPRPQ